LVPQDPNDEPASVLVERIKAGRIQQAQSQLKRSRKTSVRKIAVSMKSGQCYSIRKATDVRLIEVQADVRTA
jgi:hypothetical protein